MLSQCACGCCSVLSLSPIRNAVQWEGEGCGRCGQAPPGGASEFLTIFNVLTVRVRRFGLSGLLAHFVTVFN